METRENKLYLFTWSPSGVTHDVTYKYREHLEQYFRKLKYCCSRFEINPELNQNGNIHYHGFVELKDEIKWYRSMLPRFKRNGFVKINPVKNDLSKAIEYARKDREKMKKIILDEPIPLTETYKFKRSPLYTTTDVMYDPITFKIIKIDKPKIKNKPEPLIPNWPSEKDKDSFGVMYESEKAYYDGLDYDFNIELINMSEKQVKEILIAENLIQ